MVTVALAAGVAAAIAWALLGWRSRRRSRRRLAGLVGELDRGLGAISETLAQALQRSRAARAGSSMQLGLVLDLDELLLRLAEEVAARTNAEAAAVRVRGAGDDEAVGTYGPDEVAELLDATPRPPDRRQFRALTINWTFPPALDTEPNAFRSALVVPVIEDGLETGAIAGYAREPSAFRPEHARALETLAAEAADGIATARRFTAMRRRSARTPGTNGESTSGYVDVEPGSGTRDADRPGDARP
jgi:hypothetical protein